ncbi:hypothetical protein [Acutalibacter intestini]|uniref:hypothetical protein n=1 Tax=Acutalibacter intestini TaxID=3093659 RepID=UPI002AC9055F|nr:hypothetical protein [Acutalibacter sp. M00204]
MTKRLVSLLMALVLTIGIFAIPAMAATPEAEELYTIGGHCAYCGNTVEIIINTSITTEYRICKKSSTHHPHKVTYEDHSYWCSKCNHRYSMGLPIELADVCKL